MFTAGCISPPVSGVEKVGGSDDSDELVVVLSASVVSVITMVAVF